MELIHPILDSDYEDDDILEPETSFSRVFNTFVNQWCIKNVFKLAFRFHAFPEISEILESHAQKNSNFQHYHETQKLQITVFWSNRKI